MGKQKVFHFTATKTEPYPDMRHYKGMMKNVRTSVCGKKTLCDHGDKECNERCAKLTIDDWAMASELTRNDVEGRDLIL